MKLDHLREFDTQNLGVAEASPNDDDASHECSISSPDRCTYEDASWQNNEDDFPTTSSGTMVCDQSNAGVSREVDLLHDGKSSDIDISVSTSDEADEGDQSNAGASLYESAVNSVLVPDESQSTDSQTYGVVPHAPYETNRILTLHVSDLSGVTEANVYKMFISFGIDTVLVMSPKTSHRYKFVVILLLDRDKAF